jgi:hypothetical protein
MATDAQILANQTNSQSSSGPKTLEGKQTASRNSFRHGLTSKDVIIEGEDVELFNELHAQLIEEHQPATVTESMLVKNMAQYYWLVQRAIGLQNSTLEAKFFDDKVMALYIRYQTTNDRAFEKSLNQLLKLRAERRREEADLQKELLNEAKIRNLNAKSEDKERETEIKTCIEAPVPGFERIPYDKLKHLFATVVREATKSA